MNSIKKNIIIICVVLSIISISLSGCINQDDKYKKNKINNPVIGENILKDPGFENISSGYWDVAGYITTNITPITHNGELYGFKIENNTLKYNNQIKYNGETSIYIEGVDVFDITVFNNWYQLINDTDLIPHGENIELSCWIKTKNAEDVLLMIQCWDSEDLSLDNMIKSQTSKSYYESINGTISWQKYSFKLIEVPSDTKVITARFGLIGTGEVWFDDVDLHTIS